MATLPSHMRTAMKAAFGLLLIALFLQRVDLDAIKNAIGRYSLSWLLAATAVMVLSWAVAAARWRIFAPSVPFARLLRLTLIGQFYSIVLPGQLAGEFAKAYRLAKGHDEAEKLAASVVVDRIIGMIALLLLAGVGSANSSLRIPAAIAWLFVGLTLSLISCLFITRAAPVYAFVSRSIARLERTRLRALALPLHRALAAWHDFGGSPQRLVGSLALGILYQVLGVLMVMLLAVNLGIALSPADWSWIVGVMSLAVLLPVTIGGIGLREGALIGCLGFAGVPAATAIALSFGILAITLVGALAGGAVEVVEMTHSSAVRPR